MILTANAFIGKFDNGVRCKETNGQHGRFYSDHVACRFKMKAESLPPQFVMNLSFQTIAKNIEIIHGCTLQIYVRRKSLIRIYREYISAYYYMLPEKIQQEQIPPQLARDSPIRFLLLFLVILVAVSVQYSFNNPQALETSMEAILQISESQFQLFYSLCALPNIFTLLFIGYFCDYFGFRITIVLLSGLVAVFQLMIAIGGYTRSYSTILVGRIFFGIVSEAVFIPQASIISFWFRGKQQAFALGIAITFPQLGNALNSLLTPIIFQQTQSLGAPLMVSFGICVLGFICALFVVFLDYRADKIDMQNQVELDEGSGEQDEEIKFSDVTKLRKQYWIVAAVCTAAMTLWIPFLDNVNRLFQKRFCYTQITAGRVVTVAYLATTVTSIPLGLFVDYFGHRRILCIAGLLVFLVAQFIILVYPQCNGEDTLGGAVAGLYLQGLGYSFYANVMVASIPLVVRMKFLGTAFGIMELMESFFQFIVPLSTGYIVSSASSPQVGYRISSGLFVIIGCAGLAMGFLLFCCITDHFKRKLDRSSKEMLLIIARRQQNPGLISQTSFSSTSSLPLNLERAASIEAIPLVVQRQLSLSLEPSLQKPLLQSFELEL